MNEQELATLWCALNCASGQDTDKMIYLVMDVIVRRVGDDMTDTRWKELGRNQKRIIKATEQI